MIKTIHTAKTILLPLSQSQLQISLYSPRTLAVDLGISIKQEVFDETAERAIKMKIAKMDAVSRELHAWYTYWLIVIKEEKTGVGLANFKSHPNEFRSVEIGYGLEESYRRKGYMTETVNGLIRWAFSHQECKAVTATDVSVQNKGAQKVLANCGFRKISSGSEWVDYYLERTE